MKPCDASVLYHGINYGDHFMDPEHLLLDVERACGGVSDTFFIRLWKEHPLSEAEYLRIARYAKERSMHFGFIYATQHRPDGTESHISPEVYAKIRAEAGEYFLGEMFGESGSERGAKDKGYYTENRRPDHAPMPPQDTRSMHEAAAEYVDYVRGVTAYDRRIGMDTMIVEATALFHYDLAGGIGVPLLEVCPADTEVAIPFLRGAARAHGAPAWGGFIAHEWYGGFRHADALKIARLDLTYKYLYLSGANFAILESGGTGIDSYAQTYPDTHPLAKNYNDVMRSFSHLAERCPRLPVGPEVKVGFLFGEDDGYTGFMGGSVWCRIDREAWGKSAPEYSWRLLDGLYRAEAWQDPHAYAEDGIDLGHTPPYGNYDAVPVSAPLSVLSKYDLLVFLGWNTMSTEQYEKLTEYVRGGGKLLACAAHLSPDADRDSADRALIGDGDLSELFGVRVTGTLRQNHGVKFTGLSAVPGVKYPGSEDLVSDPIFPEGFIDVCKIERAGAEPVAYFDDRFSAPDDLAAAMPAVTEYENGKGVAVLVCATDYPGAPALAPLYRTVLYALLRAEAARCPLRVWGSDRVRYSLFTSEDAKRAELVFLNTSADTESVIRYRFRDREEKLVLAPKELKTVYM